MSDSDISSTPSPSSATSLPATPPPKTPPNMHQNSIDPSAKWLVQKFGGTSIGKFAVRIAEDIVSLYRPAQGGHRLLRKIGLNKSHGNNKPASPSIFKSPAPKWCRYSRSYVRLHHTSHKRTCRFLSFPVQFKFSKSQRK